LNRLASETINLHEKVPGPPVHMETRLSKGLPPAWADQSQIEQVIMNLCLNARDAMPEGGTLRIETKRVGITAEQELARPYFKAGEYVAIFITDTGTGMEPEVVERIFEPFFTTKGVAKGTGLGLATVYGIVKQHDGIIHVDSELGRGTTFQVYLPVGTGRPEMPLRTHHLPVRRGSETILVVEDNDGVRDAMREILEAWGHKVLVASSTESAAGFFRSHGGAIELAIVDVGVAGIRGASAFARVSERKFDLPTILTHGIRRRYGDFAAKLSHRVRVLHKPFNFGKLNETIRDLLDGGKYEL
jgi:CheY-like chemotaxis protein